MKYTPKEIKKEIEKLFDQYEQGLYDLAQKVMDEKLSKTLDNKGLSFCMMNGFPCCYDKDGQEKPTITAIVNLYDVEVEGIGTPFTYYLPDYDPFKQDFSQLDIDNFNKKMENVTENEAALSCFMSFNSLGI